MSSSQFKPVPCTPFLEFRPDGSDFKLAAEKSERMGILPNSHTRGEGRMSGFLGEIAVAKYLSGMVDDCSEQSRSYDLKATNGLTIEVKTKRAKGIPKPEYNASVEKKATAMFKNDFFVFLRCHNSLAKLWVLGWVKTRSFKRMATFIPAGETDDTGFTYRIDGWHLPIGKLKPIQTLVHCLKQP
jgi:hypothetical protein